MNEKITITSVRILVCDRIQLLWINMRLSICNNVMTIVNDSCLFVCLFYIHIYIQFIDVSGLLDFHKSNGTNGIRKERK